MRAPAAVASFRAPATAFIAQAVNQVYQLAITQGHGERFMPVLPGILAEFNGCKIRDLDG
jgi:hypothetical protein